MLHVKSLSYSYPGAVVPALADVSLGVRAGECVCITGPSGSGKTTLLLAVKGLLHAGSLGGEIAAGASDESPRETGRQEVGLVFQNAESQILCSTVAEEIAFGPENLCVPPREIRERIDAAARDVRLTGFESRNVERLSAGQKHRLAVASVLSMRPRVLLLDEPTSQLDAAGRSELVAVLAGLKRQGYALLVVEHDLEPFRGLADRCLQVHGGRLLAETSGPAPEGCSARAPAPRPSGRCPADASDPHFVDVDDLRLSYPGVGEVLRGVRLSIAQGERVQLYGQNGSGKSTLLACLVGAVEPDSGTIRVADSDRAPRPLRNGRVPVPEPAAPALRGHRRRGGRLLAQAAPALRTGPPRARGRGAGGVRGEPPRGALAPLRS